MSLKYKVKRSSRCFPNVREQRLLALLDSLNSLGVIE